MADLTYMQYVRTQQNRSKRVDEIMESGFYTNEASELNYAEKKFMYKHMRNIKRLGRMLDGNQQHWNQYYKDYK
jgi:hypothetical protein